MRGMRAAMLATMMVAVGLGVGASPARAGGPGEPVLGDYNNDGITDSVALGSVNPNLCSTIVEYGSAPGDYLPPIAFTYLRMGTGEDLRCPDTGAAFDRNVDGRDDLIVGWSDDPPAGLDFNRLILLAPTFQPLTFSTARIDRVTFLGAAVFTVGGPPSPYAIGPGGLSTGVFEGTSLIAGPVQFCSADAPAVQLTDWDQDDASGVLLSYTDACDGGGSGVVRIRDEGMVVQLEHDPTGRATWSARVFNANDDRFPDARTINWATGEVSYFINTGPSSEYSLVRAPDANTDRVQLTQVKPLAIDVLANDYAARHVDVIITGQPRYGSVQVQSDGRILYRPDPRHGRTDRFTYQLLEEGKRSSATVTVIFPPA